MWRNVSNIVKRNGGRRHSRHLCFFLLWTTPQQVFKAPAKILWDWRSKPWHLYNWSLSPRTAAGAGHCYTANTAGRCITVSCMAVLHTVLPHICSRALNWQNKSFKWSHPVCRVRTTAPNGLRERRTFGRFRLPFIFYYFVIQFPFWKKMFTWRLLLIYRDNNCSFVSTFFFLLTTKNIARCYYIIISCLF